MLARFFNEGKSLAMAKKTIRQPYLVKWYKKNGSELKKHIKYLEPITKVNLKKMDRDSLLHLLLNKLHAWELLTTRSCGGENEECLEYTKAKLIQRISDQDKNLREWIHILARCT